MIVTAVKKIKELLHNQLFLALKVKTKKSSLLTLGTKITYRGGTIRLGSQSSLTIKSNVLFDGNVFIEDNCSVTIHEDCVLKNTIMRVSNNSTVELLPGAIIHSSDLSPICINVDCGNLKILDRAHLQCNILVRFGGHLHIGSHAGIGQGSELRCEEKMHIGDYSLISYDVCIYDTNTHSTNSLERRQRIDKGYPIGMSEVEKPKTKPVYIGNDVWIGKGATITKGTSIGDRSIVGIRTVVGGGCYTDDSIIVSSKPRIITKC